MNKHFNRPGDSTPPPQAKLPNGVTIYQKHRDFTTVEVPGLNFFCTVPRSRVQLALLRDTIDFLLTPEKVPVKK